MELFKTVPAYFEMCTNNIYNCSRIFMAIYLFSQILKFTKYSIKLIEKLSKRHLINSSDVFVVKGFTV